jgi:serralysin
MCELCGDPAHVVDEVLDDGGVGGIGILAVTPGTVGRPPTALSPESGNDFVDAIINNGRHYVNPVGVTGPVQINYFFTKLPGPGNPTTGVGIPYDWRPFEMAAFSKAIQGWEHVANIDFVQVFDVNDAAFVERLENQATAGGTVSASHSLPSASASAQSQGTYNFEAVNVRQWTPDELEPGGNFFRTFIHETGHGLGLKHPHDPGSGAFNPDFFPGINPSDDSAVRQRSLGVLELNHMFGSVMSYLHGYEFDDAGHIDLVATRQRPVADDFFLDHGFAATPMAYDIAAIQYMYGANMSYNTGNNVYLLPDSNDPHPFVRGAPNEVGERESIIYQPDTAFWTCIWDAGGIDEIRYDVQDANGSYVAGKRNVIIDLTAATLDYSETGYGVLSYAAFIGGGYTIAHGVVIENATGGDGNDSLTGNSADNVINGRGGNDVLSGKGGADTLVGGDGFDTAIFQGKFSDYAFEWHGADAKLTSHGVAVSTQGIERFIFSDRMYEPNDANPLVDDAFYFDKYGDVSKSGVDADVHFAGYGWKEARDPNAFFDTEAYLAANADVKAAGLNPLEHYHTTGWKQGRDPGPNFDTTLYLNHNPDVAKAGIDPLQHYLQFGQYEGRQTYQAIGSSIVNDFDAEYYLFHNPEVAAAGMDPLKHYQTYGWKEGRDPNGFFDTSEYLSHYADVAAKGIDPLQHYHTTGWKEGRDPSADFDTKAYLAHYADVAGAHTDPLEHFLKYGIYEGRSAFGDGVMA